MFLYIQNYVRCTSYSSLNGNCCDLNEAFVVGIILQQIHVRVFDDPGGSINEQTHEISDHNPQLSRNTLPVCADIFRDEVAKRDC